MRDNHELLDSTGDGHPTSSSSNSTRPSQSSGENAQGGDLIVGEASIGITELRKAEEALVESEERFRQMADHFEDVIWITDRDIKKILYINPAYEKVFGRSRESLYECLTSFGEAVHPDDRGRMEGMLERQRGGDLTPVEYRIVRPDGSVRWMQRRSFPIRNKDGEVYRLAGIAQDITERRRAQEELRESEERFRQLSEAPFEAIVLHDNGTILEVNQSFCQMYGYERAEVIGRSVLDLTPPELREALLQRVRSAGIGPFEGLALRKDGTIFRAELAAKPIHYQGRAVRVAAIRDITEQKRNERRQTAQYAVTRVLAESATPAEAIPQLLQVICETLRWKMGEFWRLCDSTNLLRCAETWHVPGLDAMAFIEASRQIEFAPGAGLPGRVWQSGEPASVPDVMTGPGFAHAAMAAKIGLRGAVAFPILVGSHTLGVMLFFSRRDPEVDEDLLKIMSAIGSQIGQFAERKRAEEALRESEKRYRDLVENSRELICTHDLNGVVLSANPAAAVALGYDLAELVGKNIQDILAPEVRNQFDGYMSRLLRDEATSGIMLVQTRSGEIRIWDYYNSLRTRGVAAPIVRGVARDITERKRAEDALRESESFRRTIVESEPECVKLVAPDYTLLDMNPAGLSMIGAVSKEEVVGCSVLSLIAPEWHDTFRQMHERVCQGESVVAEFEIIGLTGVRRRMETHAAPLRDRESKVIAQLAITLDITERKRAEESLRLFRNLIDQSSDAIEVIDPSTFRFIDCNQSAYRSLGYSREEFLSLTVFDIDPVADRSMLARLNDEVKESGFATLESVHLRKDGTTFPVEVNVKLVRLESDYRLAVVRDITSRQRAEEALREREAKLSAIYGAAPVGIGVDVNRVIQEVNDTLCSITGYSREELIGQDSRFLFLTAEDYERVGREKHRVTAEQFSKSIMARLKRKDDRIIDVLLSSVPLDAADLSQGFIFTVLDITERKHAEEALRESEERYRELFENARDAIYVHDLSGRYTSINRAAEELSGFRREEIIGRHYSNFVAPSHLKYARESFCKKLDETLETNYEAEIISKNGRRTPVEISSRLIYENGVPIGIQGTARDISERKQTQEALRIYSRALIDAQETERQNIARELHDEIGQVLTAIRINLETIKGSCQADGCLPQIEDSIVIVDEAVERVRDLSLSLRPSLLDNLGLNAALRWYVDRYAQRTGIGAVVRSSPREQHLRREVETACFRIVQEALTNVARHAKAKRVTVQLKKTRGRLMLTVKDDGAGFDREILSNSAATALGLRGMEERAHSVGGSFEIRSELLKGTQILAAFPIEIESEARGRSASEEFKRRDGIRNLRDQKLIV